MSVDPWIAELGSGPVDLGELRTDVGLLHEIIEGQTKSNDSPEAITSMAAHGLELLLIKHGIGGGTVLEAVMDEEATIRSSSDDTVITRVPEARIAGVVSAVCFNARKEDAGKPDYGLAFDVKGVVVTDALCARSEESLRAVGHLRLSRMVELRILST